MKQPTTLAPENEARSIDNKTIETLKEIEKAEQKARDMANFCISISQKWESRLAQKKES